MVSKVFYVLFKVISFFRCLLQKTLSKLVKKSQLFFFLFFKTTVHYVKNADKNFDKNTFVITNKNTFIFLCVLTTKFKYFTTYMHLILRQSIYEHSVCFLRFLKQDHQYYRNITKKRHIF